METEEPVPSSASQPHIVPVRSLVEFVLQAGDLTPGGFQRRDRAQQGTLGHRRVQRSRPEGYMAEVELSCLVEGSDPPLEVRGRMDGLYPDRDPVIVEEIKTTTLELDQINEDNNHLHWAQAQCYAYMLARKQGLREVGVHLTYYHLDTREEKTFRRVYPFEALETFFFNLVNTYMDWHRRVSAWQQERDLSIQRLEFPYTGYRPGQREMAVAVYKAIREGERLYVQSPTGVGKTIAALFPAVKALRQGLAERIFYLTAKTSGRTVAEKALNDMRQAGLRFRSVTLTAKEKICFCPPVNCDPEVCIFARGYFDRVKLALQELDRHQDLTRPVIEAIARQYQICPFEFSLDAALWVDCVICDYNHAFDPRVYLHRFFDFSDEQYIFLIDEAHNLPDRTRSMYSAELEKKNVLDLQHALKPHLPALAKKLGEINKVFLEIRKACQAQEREFLVEHALPADLLKVVREFTQKAEDWLSMNLPAEFRPELLDFYFACINYMRTAEYFDTFYVSYFERRGQSNIMAKLFCLDPAPMLAGPLDRSRAAIFFSATLLPMDYFMKLLTGSDPRPSCVFQSPFPLNNVSLLVQNNIATTYARREESYASVASAIISTCAAREGNYLVFFPSYAYMEAVVDLLKERLSPDQLIVQGRSMTESEREDFLARFSASRGGTLVGLAVMGGIFGEGIDLVGDRLIGVVVVGVGVPQLGLERDLIKEYFDGQGVSGFAYAYQYPGFNRVLQATGRVIRSETDRGVIVLLDERFTHPRYRRLFPSHWQGFQVVGSSVQLRERLARFWSEPQG